ncbi:MAG: PilZ domain-containing protein, partial [Pseudomonadota bacterium]
GRPVPCKVGNQVVIRLFVNHLNCACAFRTNILHTSSVPYAHLFLAIPEKMEVGEIRSSVRASSSLVCFITSSSPHRNETIKATINNLSIDGAKVFSEQFLGDPEEKVSLKAKIKVLDIEEVIEVEGVIRSMSGGNEQFTYGIQFLNVDSAMKLLIYAYVMSEIKS